MALAYRNCVPCSWIDAFQHLVFVLALHAYLRSQYLSSKHMTMTKLTTNLGTRRDWNLFNFHPSRSFSRPLVLGQASLCNRSCHNWRIHRRNHLPSHHPKSHTPNRLCLGHPHRWFCPNLPTHLRHDTSPCPSGSYPRPQSPGNIDPYPQQHSWSSPMACTFVDQNRSKGIPRPTLYSNNHQCLFYRMGCFRSSYLYHIPCFEPRLAFGFIIPIFGYSQRRFSLWAMVTRIHRR